MFWFDFHWQIQHLLNQWWWPLNIALVLLLMYTAAMSWKRPEIAAAVTVACLPTYLIRSELFGVPFTFLELLIITTIVGWVVFVARHGTWRALYRFPFRVPWLLVLTAATVSVFAAPDVREAAGIWKAYFLEPMLLYVVLHDVLSHHKNRSLILSALAIPVLIIAGLALYQKITGFAIAEPSWIAEPGRRVTAFFSSPNAVGLFVVPAILLYLGWAMDRARSVSLGAKLFVITLGVFAVYVTASEGSFLALGAGILFFIFFGATRRLRTFLATVAIAGLLLVPVAALLSGTLLSASPSAMNRLTLWRMVTDFITSSPLHFVFGAGLMGFEKIQNVLRDPAVMEPLLYPHNLIFNFWIELGLTGMLSMLVVLFVFFKKGFAGEKNWMKLGVMAAMVAIIAHGAIDVPYFKNDLAVLFWLIVALI